MDYPLASRQAMTKALSPAAQAVLDAFRTSHTGQGCLAAALRAAANQLNPKQHIEDIDYVHQSYVDGWSDALNLIIDIAEDLEAL